MKKQEKPGGGYNMIKEEQKMKNELEKAQYMTKMSKAILLSFLSKDSKYIDEFMDSEFMDKKEMQ